MLSNRLVYAAFSLAVIIYFLSTWPWVSYFLLLVAVFLPLLSLLLSFFAVKKISYTISAPKAVLRGTDFTITVSDKSTTRHLSYHVEMEVSNGGDGQSLWTADMFCKNNSDICITAEHSGCIRCSVRTAYACDLLGLFRFRLPKAHDTITVSTPIPTPFSASSELLKTTNISYRPKLGGGFAEVYDMREYKPGDSLRDIHWKLSAKTDKLIVREPQIPDGGLTLILIDLLPVSDELDIILDCTVWLSRHLLDNGISHDIRWISPVSRHVESVTVESFGDFDLFLRTALKTGVTSPLPSISNIHFYGAERVIYVNGEVTK